MSLQSQSDLTKLGRIYRMFEVIELMEFNTDECKDVHAKLVQSISEVIKPELVKTGNKIKNNGKQPDNAI